MNTQIYSKENFAKMDSMHDSVASKNFRQIKHTFKEDGYDSDYCG